MIRFIGKIVFNIVFICERFMCKYLVTQFKQTGDNCRLEGRGHYSYKNIILEDNVFLGPDNIFLSSNANIMIGSNVMFGPHVILITGNHRSDVLGKYMIDVTEKLPNDDQDIVIEDDVWIGAGVIILKGVTIGKGSIVGAGSVVTKDIPPYSIYVGNTPKKMFRRFSDIEIQIHEAKLEKSKIE